MAGTVKYNGIKNGYLLSSAGFFMACTWRLLETLKGLLTDVVLNFAGVGRSHFFADAQGHQHFPEHAVALVDAAGYLFSGRSEEDLVGAGIHGDITAVFQQAHGVADAGLAEAHFVGDVHRPDKTCSLMKDEDGFQIVFTGFLEFHGEYTPFGRGI